MEFDFSTNQQLDALDNVPEQFRGAYQQQDGKYTLNPTLKGITEAVDGLNKALKSERTAHGTLKAQKDVAAQVKEALGELGINSLEDAKTRISELTATVAEKGKVDPAKIKAEIEATFASERQGFQTRIEKMQGTLDRYLIDNAATTALAAEKGNIELLLPHIKAKAKVVADGDEFVVRVLDADGQYRGDGKGGFMSVADLVKELKGHASFKAAFASDAPTGGGLKDRTQQPSRTQQQMQRKAEGDARTPQDRIQAGLAARRGGR